MNEKQISRAEAGKYLTFQLSSEVYGIEILRVHEIIGMMKITRMPKAPREIRGVINLRGKVIAVVDLRLKFDMEPIADTEKTCICVVQTSLDGKAVTIGIVVDNVREVLNVTDSQMEPAPSFGSAIQNDFILGLAKVGTDVITLLDIDKVLASNSSALVDTAGEPQEVQETA